MGLTARTKINCWNNPETSHWCFSIVLSSEGQVSTNRLVSSHREPVDMESFLFKSKPALGFRAPSVKMGPRPSRAFISASLNFRTKVWWVVEPFDDGLSPSNWRFRSRWVEMGPREKKPICYNHKLRTQELKNEGLVGCSTFWREPFDENLLLRIQETENLGLVGCKTFWSQPLLQRLSNLVSVSWNGSLEENCTVWMQQLGLSGFWWSKSSNKYPEVIWWLFLVELVDIVFMRGLVTGRISRMLLKPPQNALKVYQLFKTKGNIDTSRCYESYRQGLVTAPVTLLTL